MTRIYKHIDFFDFIKIGLLCYVLLGTQLGFSATNDSLINSPKTIQYDRESTIAPVYFNQKDLENYKADKDFQYDTKVHKISWWERFKGWLAYLWFTFWQKIFGVKAGGWLSTFVQILKYAFIGAVIFFIGWLFVRLNPGRAYLKTKDNPEVFLTEDDQIIKEEDIPKLIHKAIQNQNYRLAVRYYYLLILKILKDKTIITYQAEKTNQEYQSEIEDQNIGKHFKDITHLYDFVWYGDFPMDQHQFGIAEKQFEAIKQILKSKPDE